MEQQTLFKGRDRRRKGWFWIDNDYLNGYARLFGTTGTAIYLSLCRHADNETQKCFPAIKTIAEELNTGESTVKQYIHIFEKYRIIFIQREKDPITKRWLNNVYQLNDKDEWIKPDKPLKKKRKRGQSQSLTVESQSQSLTVESQSQRKTEPEPTVAKSQSQPLAHKETNIYNKTHSKEATPPAIADNINSLIELFKPINPTYERLFSNKTQRDSLERLVKKFGREKIENMIKYLPQIFGKTYAPRITTPYLLEQKLADLLAYIKSEKSKAPKGVIIR